MFNKITNVLLIVACIFIVFLFGIVLSRPATVEPTTITVNCNAPATEEDRYNCSIKEKQSQYATVAESKRQYAASCVMERAMEQEMRALNLQAQSLRDQLSALKIKQGKEQGRQ